MPTPVINTQLTDLNGKLDGIIDAIGDLPFNGVDQAVSDWLDDHPAATTTVQDGAVTWAKLASDVKGPTAYQTRVLDADVNTIGSNPIYLNCAVNVYDEITILIYQSDTANNGNTWSDGDLSYITMRDSTSGSGTGYITPGDSIRNGLKGSKPVMIRIKRIPDALVSELIYDNEVRRFDITPRDPSYTDHLSWFGLSAGTGKLLKAGTKIIVMVGRTM